MDTLGKRIKFIIDCNKLTMTEFAVKLNISQSMVSKICADKAIPSERTLLDICRIFNINIKWLQHNQGEIYDAHPGDKEFIAFDQYMDSMGYSLNLELSNDNPDCNWTLYDKQNGRKYYVEASTLDKLMHDVNSYLKFQIASIIADSTILS